MDGPRDYHTEQSKDGPRDYHTERSKSDRETQISYDTTYMRNLKKRIQINLFTKQKQTHRLREGTYGYRGEGWEEGVVRELGMTCTHCQSQFFPSPAHTPPLCRLPGDLH